MEILLAIIIIILVVVIPSIKIVPQAKSYVIERLGSYYQTWGNGLHFKIRLNVKKLPFKAPYSLMASIP